MKEWVRFSLFSYCLGLALAVSAAQPAEPVTTITTIAPQSAADGSYRYFVDLLDLALKATTKEFGPYQLLNVGTPMSQARALEELETGNLIQVYWAGTNPEREQNLLPVRIPLTKGLVGYRMPIIRSEDLPRWQQIDSLQKLQSMVACQVSSWPDSDIMEMAGLKVERVPVFKGIYAMLAGKRCDFAPRGIHEAFSEVTIEKQEYPDLMVYTGLVLHYPFALYFFVPPNQPQLAKRIEVGLDRLIDSGEFDRYLKSHPVTSPVFPLSQWKNTKMIVIDNPLLPPQSNPKNKRYWITEDQFGK